MTSLKNPHIHLPKWTEAAKGQPCTLTIPGVCQDEPSHATTVACHLPSEGKGVAYKTDDTASVDGCHACHAAIDGDWERATRGMYDREDREYFMRRALQRTIRNRIERGIVK